MKVKIKFSPEHPVHAGYLPIIDIIDPHDRNKRIIEYPEFNDAGEAFFELEAHVASMVLAGDGHLYKLWSPQKFVIAAPGEHGTTKLVTLHSIDPSLRPSEAVVADAGAAAEGAKNAAKVEKGGKKVEKGEKKIAVVEEPRLTADELVGGLDAALGREA